MSNSLAIDATFAKQWQINGQPMLARYKYKGGQHRLKTRFGVLEKSMVCVSPDGDKYEVISSERFNTSTYLHTLQPLNDKPQTDWTPQR